MNVAFGHLFLPYRCVSVQNQAVFSNFCFLRKAQSSESVATGIKVGPYCHVNLEPHHVKTHKRNASNVSIRSIRLDATVDDDQKVIIPDSSNLSFYLYDIVTSNRIGIFAGVKWNMGPDDVSSFLYEAQILINRCC